MKKTLYSLACVLALLCSCEDENSSDQDEIKVDCSESSLSLAVNSTTQADCDANGTVSLAASGGEGEYTYTLNGVSNSNGQFDGLLASNYTATVKDKVGCQATQSVTVEPSEDAISLNISLDASAGCGGSTGGFSATATGGTGEIQYSLEGASFSTEAVYSNLEAGIYELMVKDEADCQITQEVKVLSGVSYDAQVADIIINNCAISGCHSSGGRSPNLSVFGNVQSFADEIKSRTQNRSMPPADRGSLSSEQIDLIACWVDDGALSN
ncbi:SprB repeat-containing protein [Reichenbachiella versicolor]|uniref:SprB repeat-containing protein n=1 Tax=Reichenbachiella versicolor TaxID=1821036 RepID=UPI000D6E936A|nr:SprB repeat-containing protein [Reichenbachiella versicolor]